MAGDRLRATFDRISSPNQALQEGKMARAPVNDGLNKSQRYRQRRAMQGMKLLRLWVPDPAAPGFAEELRRQVSLLRGAPEEREALDFIEANADTAGWR
jgi:predicted xylose isomerase-like sugar epimerase